MRVLTLLRRWLRQRWFVNTPLPPSTTRASASATYSRQQPLSLHVHVSSEFPLAALLDILGLISNGDPSYYHIFEQLAYF